MMSFFLAMTLGGNKLWYLKNFNFLGNMPPEKIDEIAGNTHMKDYPKGHILYEPGAETNQIYLLKQGEVILYHERDGKRIVFDTLGPGSIFGGISLKPEKIEHFAEVALGSKICNFPQEVIIRIISANPSVMINFWQEVSGRLSEYEYRLKDSSAPASELLFNEIKRLKATRQKSMFGILKRPLVITHEELAKRSGLNRVTVTREMKSLRESGRISINPKSGAISVVEKGDKK